MIPEVLKNFVEYEGLNEIQKQNFISRLKYINKITIKIDDFTGVDVYSRKEKLHFFLDDLELDLFSNLSHGNVERMLSPWCLHSSWAAEIGQFDIPKFVDRSPLDNVFIMRVDSKSKPMAIDEWMKVCSNALKFYLDAYRNALNIESVLANLIALDACLSEMLSVTIALRLNINIYD